MIGAPTTLTTSGQHSHYFGPSSSSNNDAATLHPVIADLRMGHVQGIGIILCQFPNYLIIYPVGPVYYCPGHPSNTISSGSLKFYIGF